MAFGQPSGPPATARQLRDLTALVEAAGHAGFRDARGPLGLTQRQAGGRFTRDEAEDLIARLEADVGGDGGAEGSDGPPDGVGAEGSRSAFRTPDRATPAPSPRAPAATRRQSLARQLERVPEDLLVDELRRRGWSVTPPGD
jgi:hypothetical protein